jgi:hypothetical protein
MTLETKKADQASGRKLTAEQIEKECPDRLRDIAKEIKARLSKADKQSQQAQDNLIAVDELLAEAKKLCDDGGFEKFQKMFCPHLGKSQAYALRAIAAGTKSLVEHRIDERDRKRKSRKALRAAGKNSGTVPEKPELTPAPHDTSAVAEDLNGVGIGDGSPPFPAKPRSAVAPIL